MQVITAIYLNCRPDLRDEWLTGIEVDDVHDAQVGRVPLDSVRRFGHAYTTSYLNCRRKNRHYATS